MLASNPTAVLFPTNPLERTERFFASMIALMAPDLRFVPSKRPVFLPTEAKRLPIPSPSGLRQLSCPRVCSEETAKKPTANRWKRNHRYSPHNKALSLFRTYEIFRFFRDHCHRLYAADFIKLSPDGLPRDLYAQSRCRRQHVGRHNFFPPVGLPNHNLRLQAQSVGEKPEINSPN